MNPLAWNPFLFTLIIVVLAALAAAWCVLQRLKRGPSGFVRKPLEDAYAIALLAEGPTTATRIALFNLVQANILGVKAGRVRLVKPQDLDLCKSPLEHAVASRAGAEGEDVAGILADPEVRRAAEAHEQPLRQESLLADRHLRGWHRGTALKIMGASGAILLIKFIADLVRNHPDAHASLIGILITAAAFGGLAAMPPRLSPRGKETLGELRRHYGTLRATFTGGGPEAPIFAALFGFTSLSKSEQAVARLLQAK
jgi:uncharacterized protein (TIGR04222 family)